MSWQDYGTESSRRRGGLLIGLNGVAQSGKDTVGKILCDRFGFKRLAFADAVREGLYQLNPIIKVVVIAQRQGFWEWFEGLPERRETRIIRLQEIVDDMGWDRAKVEYAEVRELMQRYGTEAGRMIHGEQCWTNIIRRAIEASPETNWVITDMRFDNEVDILGQMHGVKVQIQREGTTSVNNHISDRVLDEKMFDYIIKNNGTLEDLEREVVSILMSLGAKKLIENDFIGRGPLTV